MTMAVAGRTSWKGRARSRLLTAVELSESRHVRQCRHTSPGTEKRGAARLTSHVAMEPRSMFEA